MAPQVSLTGYVLNIKRNHNELTRNWALRQDFCENIEDTWAETDR